MDLTFSISKTFWILSSLDPLDSLDSTDLLDSSDTMDLVDSSGPMELYLLGTSDNLDS